MHSDDRGLGGIIYGLMMGQVDRKYFPGLNVLIRDETKPGGLWHRHTQAQRAAVKRFLAAHPNDDEALMFCSCVDPLAGAVRELALQMARYCLGLAPMFQPRDPLLGPDTAARWNLYWAGGEALSPREQAALSAQLSKELSDYADEMSRLAAEDERP